jgi:hypothetical protein
MLPCAAEMARPAGVLFPVQWVDVQTVFVHWRLAFDLRAMPAALRPFLCLYQELILETDVSRPGTRTRPYTEVVTALTDEACE